MTSKYDEEACPNCHHLDTNIASGRAFKCVRCGYSDKYLGKKGNKGRVRKGFGLFGA